MSHPVQKQVEGLESPSTRHAFSIHRIVFLLSFALRGDRPNDSLLFHESEPGVFGRQGKNLLVSLRKHPEETELSRINIGRPMIHINIITRKLMRSAGAPSDVNPEVGRSAEFKRAVQMRSSEPVGRPLVAIQ